MTLGTRQLGSQGLEASEVGLGCMGMSQSYGPADEAESIVTLHRAIELGCSFLDTAEVYGPFTNEDLLGRALVGKRDKVVIATKFGFKFEDGRNVGTGSRPSISAWRSKAPSSGRAPIISTCSTSIASAAGRRWRMSLAPSANWGSRARYGFFGLSEVGGANIRRAHAVHPVSAVQSEYSLWERNLEQDVIPALRELHIGLVPLSPLGRGFLTGEVKRAEDYPEDDFHRNDPRYQDANDDANVAATQTVRDIAAGLHVKPGQVAVAWVLHKRNDSVPIPGTKRGSYLDENVTATAIALDVAKMEALDDALAAGKIAGPRYTERMMATVDH